MCKLFKKRKLLSQNEENNLTHNKVKYGVNCNRNLKETTRTNEKRNSDGTFLKEQMIRYLIQYYFWVDHVLFKNKFGRSHTTSQPKKYLSLTYVTDDVDKK